MIAGSYFRELRDTDSSMCSLIIFLFVLFEINVECLCVSMFCQTLNIPGLKEGL